METLSRREEEEIMADAKTYALKQCDTFVKDFADCATGRILSLPFKCRTQLRTMQGCMKEYMTEERIDDMKLEYISNRSEKGRIAVESLKASRLEKFKKMAGRKDG